MERMERMPTIGGGARARRDRQRSAVPESLAKVTTELNLEDVEEAKKYQITEQLPKVSVLDIAVQQGKVKTRVQEAQEEIIERGVAQAQAVQAKKDAEAAEALEKVRQEVRQDIAEHSGLVQPFGPEGLAYIDEEKRATAQPDVAILKPPKIEAESRQLEVQTGLKLTPGPTVYTDKDVGKLITSGVGVGAKLQPAEKPKPTKEELKGVDAPMVEATIGAYQETKKLAKKLTADEKDLDVFEAKSQEFGMSAYETGVIRGAQEMVKGLPEFAVDILGKPAVLAAELLDKDTREYAKQDVLIAGKQTPGAALSMLDLSDPRNVAPFIAIVVGGAMAGKARAAKFEAARDAAKADITITSDLLTERVILGNEIADTTPVIKAKATVGKTKYDIKGSSTERWFPEGQHILSESQMKLDMKKVIQVDVKSTKGKWTGPVETGATRGEFKLIDPDVTTGKPSGKSSVKIYEEVMLPFAEIEAKGLGRTKFNELNESVKVINTETIIKLVEAPIGMIDILGQEIMKKQPLVKKSILTKEVIETAGTKDLMMGKETVFSDLGLVQRKVQTKLSPIEYAETLANKGEIRFKIVHPEEMPIPDALGVYDYKTEPPTIWISDKSPLELQQKYTAHELTHHKTPNIFFKDEFLPYELQPSEFIANLGELKNTFTFKETIMEPLLDLEFNGEFVSAKMAEAILPDRTIEVWRTKSKQTKAGLPEGVRLTIDEQLLFGTKEGRGMGQIKPGSTGKGSAGSRLGLKTKRLQSFEDLKLTPLSEARVEASLRSVFKELGMAKGRRLSGVSGMFRGIPIKNDTLLGTGRVKQSFTLDMQVLGKTPLTFTRPGTKSRGLGEIDAVSQLGLGRQKPMTGLKPIIDLKPITAQKPIVELKPVTVQKPKPVTAQKPIVELKPVTVQKPVIRPITIPIQRPIVRQKPLQRSPPQQIPVFDVPNVPPPIIPGGLLSLSLPHRTISGRGRKEQGHNVYMFEFGKKVKANLKPLPFTEADRLGRDIADNSLSASYRVTPTKSRVPSARRSALAIGADPGPGKFRRGKTKARKGYTVEKRQYRLDSLGELQGISAAKLISERKRLLDFGKQKKSRESRSKSRSSKRTKSSNNIWRRLI